jgi:hypothetical protein
MGMNSVQVSDDHDRPGEMMLGNSQYILVDEPDLVHVVILHHPLDWFKDKARRSHTYITGHV